MVFTSLARFFSFSSLRLRHRRDGAAHRRRQLRGSSRRVHGITTIKANVQGSDMEAASIDFDMRSSRSMSASFCFSRRGGRTVYLGLDATEASMRSMRSFRAVDPVELVKNDQKKLRKALEHAMKQERKEARKMQKLIEKSAKGFVNRCSSSKRIALLSAGSVSDCSVKSDQDILAEIWAKRSPSLDCVSDEDLPEVDDELSETAPMEFLFFAGCPDDKNLRELDVGYRRLRSNPRSARYPPTPSYATTVPIKPTLVSKMPPLFALRYDVVRK